MRIEIARECVYDVTSRCVRYVTLRCVALGGEGEGGESEGERKRGRDRALCRPGREPFPHTIRTVHPCACGVYTRCITRRRAAVKNRYRLNGSTDMYGKRRERARASERPRRLVERGLERKSIRGNPLSRRMFPRRVPRRRRRRACATLTYIDLSPSLSSTQTTGSPGAFPRARFRFLSLSSPSLRSHRRPFCVHRQEGIDLCLGEDDFNCVFRALSNFSARALTALIWSRLCANKNEGNYHLFRYSKLPSFIKLS